MAHSTHRFRRDLFVENLQIDNCSTRLLLKALSLSHFFFFPPPFFFFAAFAAAAASLAFRSSSSATACFKFAFSVFCSFCASTRMASTVPSVVHFSTAASSWSLRSVSASRSDSETAPPRCSYRVTPSSVVHCLGSISARRKSDSPQSLRWSCSATATTSSKASALCAAAMDDASRAMPTSARVARPEVASGGPPCSSTMVSAWQLAVTSCSAISASTALTSRSADSRSSTLADRSRAVLSGCSRGLIWARSLSGRSLLNCATFAWSSICAWSRSSVALASSSRGADAPTFSPSLIALSSAAVSSALMANCSPSSASAMRCAYALVYRTGRMCGAETRSITTAATESSSAVNSPVRLHR
mmetsp:Transcript_11020/g.23563  ORF Transcript_11020/g.23563 Transcript_11020/m.23563 type:complete len:359 (-) Transcript_11020:616-1692(-)